MAEILAEDYSGGSDEATITTGNSSYDSLFASGSASLAFDDAVDLFSGLSGRHLTTASGETTNWRWDHTAETELWFRYYFRISDATPASNFVLFAFHNGANRIAEVQITSGGLIRLRDNGNTQRYINSTPVTANEWVRIEGHFVFSTTTGHMELQIFMGANVNGTTPDETIGNQTDNWDTGASSDNIRGGLISSPAQAITLWDTRISVDDAAFPGPVITGPVYPDAVENVMVSTIDEDELQVTWDEVSGGDGTYAIRRQIGPTVDDEGPILVASHATTTFNDSGLASGTEYSYKVRANPA